jgi:hypothetical protein
MKTKISLTADDDEDVQRSWPIKKVNKIAGWL